MSEQSEQSEQVPCTNPAYPVVSLQRGRTLTFSAFAQQQRYLEGRILTTIDAAFADVVQRKAVKDLVRLHFADQDRYVNRLCFGDLKEGEEGVIVVDSGVPPT